MEENALQIEAQMTTLYIHTVMHGTMMQNALWVPGLKILTFQILTKTTVSNLN